MHQLTKSFLLLINTHLNYILLSLHICRWDAFSNKIHIYFCFLLYMAWDNLIKRIVKLIKLPHNHCNPKMSTSLSISIFFLILTFTTYSNAFRPNIKISNVFGTGDENQRQELMESAPQDQVPTHGSSEHQDSSYQKQVKPHDHPRCDGIHRILVEKEPPKVGLGPLPTRNHGKKPKPTRWSKWKPRFPCMPKRGRKKSPPRPGPWWPPVWPPLTPVTTKIQTSPLVSWWKWLLSLAAMIN